jgi:hypothetical protein
MAIKGIKRRQKKSAVEAVGPPFAWGAYYKGLAAQQSNILTAWRTTGLIPFSPQIVISKLPIRPITPPESTQTQLVLNGASPLNLLVGANNDYVTKATQAI